MQRIQQALFAATGLRPVMLGVSAPRLQAAFLPPSAVGLGVSVDESSGIYVVTDRNGDALGSESRSDILRAVREDGVIVKPGAPRLPADAGIVAAAAGLHPAGRYSHIPITNADGDLARSVTVTLRTKS